MAYVLDEDNDGLYELYIGQNGGVRANSICAYLFSNYINVTNIELNNIDTSSVIYMNQMFQFCSNLTSLDLGSNFDTSAVTMMSSMFFNCSSLTNLNLGENFDTSAVTNMSDMFRVCSKLVTIYVTNDFDTTNVTNSPGMFYGDTNLVGGNGTTHSSSHLDARYAKIDAHGTPGYFTQRPS